MAKCFITGGAGFIGSHLVEVCLDRGFSVIVLDDLSTGKKENLPLNHAQLEFIEGDITDRDSILQVKRRNPDIDYIFHLAAIASVTKSMERPLETHQVNFMGTLVLLDVFRDSGLKKMVYASSAAVYGEPEKIPLREDAPPGPMSPYGADKLQGEYYLKIFNDSFDLPTVACRFFNVFGERQDPSSPYSGVISIFFDKILSKKRKENAAITIFGEGTQTRDFIYVKDIVRALVFLAEKPTIRGDIFNLGYGKKITILKLAQKMRDLVGVNIDIQHREAREGDIRDSQSDIEKLRATGFRFKYDIDKGLQRLAEFLL